MMNDREPRQKTRGHHPTEDDGPWMLATLLIGYIIRGRSAPTVPIRRRTTRRVTNSAE